MRSRNKLILIALTTTALLALAVSDAAARSLRVNERNFELIWNGALGSPKTALGLQIAGENPRCNVTLLGRYNETTIKKETLLNQGSINHGELNGCSATIRTETLPWILRYRGFTGTLPRIHGISLGLIGGRFRFIALGGLSCEFGTEANHPGVFIVGDSSQANEIGFETTGEPEDIAAEPSNGIPLGGGFLCTIQGIDLDFNGIGLIRNLPRTAKLRITLI